LSVPLLPISLIAARPLKRDGSFTQIKIVIPNDPERTVGDSVASAQTWPMA